jgi:hypothetical protein
MVMKDRAVWTLDAMVQYSETYSEWQMVEALEYLPRLTLST